MPPTLADVIGLLEQWFPPSAAESWDHPGLVCGDPAAEIRRVMFAVDPTAEVVAEALDWGADLLVTHHPLLLRGVHSVAATTYKGALVHRLIRGGCALHAAHTNADAVAGGVAEALADLIGVTSRVPMVETEPGVGIGRVGRLAVPVTLRDLAQRVADALPPTVTGVRVAGDPDAEVTTVAVVGGAGDSLFDAVRASGADVYITADLRHHPVSELRERATLEAGSIDPAVGTPYLIEVSHAASEWPWLAGAAERLVEEVAGRWGVTVDTRVSTRRTDPWTFRLDPSGDLP